MLSSILSDQAIKLERMAILQSWAWLALRLRREKMSRPNLEAGGIACSGGAAGGVTARRLVVPQYGDK